MYWLVYVLVCMCMGGGGGGRGFLTLLNSTEEAISILINANHINLYSVFHLLFFFISSHLFFAWEGGELGFVSFSSAISIFLCLLCSDKLMFCRNDTGTGGRGDRLQSLKWPLLICIYPFSLHFSLIFLPSCFPVSFISVALPLSAMEDHALYF